MKARDALGVIRQGRELAARLSRRMRGRGQAPTALSTFLRPNLGSTPRPLARVLEPIVALSALLALALLLSLGVFSMVGLSLTGGLAYLIVTRVFGLELGLATDGNSWL